MSTINPSLYSGQYYQIANQNSGASSGSTTSSSSTPSLASALAALTGTNNNSSTGTSGSYMLDLSQEAQDYLNSVSNVSSGSTSSTGSNFQLTSKQKQTLDTILAGYKDKALTQENYEALQQALNDAGLSPDQLSLQDHVRNFSATQMLVDALSGKDSGSIPTTNTNSVALEEQDKADTYMSGILKQWQAIAGVTDAEA